MISLLTFIRTGRLGEVGLGAPREEVEAAFGSPPSWDAQSQPESAQIWKYGAMEIYFDEHRVWMIFTDDLRSDLNMGDIAFDASCIDGKMSASDVEEWLVTNAFEFKREGYSWCDEGVRFQTNSGVTLTLCADEEGKLARLCSLALVRR